MVIDNDYFIYSGYKINEYPSHHDDRDYTDEGQNEVYQYAKKIYDENSYSKVIDIGCGSGYKLMKYFSSADTTGIETEPCLSLLREKYPDRNWISSGEPEKSFSKVVLSGDIIICADVIEHILDPDSLIDYINSFNFKKVVLSTPDRGILRTYNGYGESAWEGPPLNSAHVREWDFIEFESYLKSKFSKVEGYRSNIQKECMFFVCEKKEIKRVLISSADFGNEFPKNIKIPEQNGNFEISIKSHDDYNNYGRHLSLSPRMKSKIPKMMDWINEKADFYIWIDSKFEIISENFVRDIISKLDIFDICLFRHPHRSSIKEESEFVLESMKIGSEYLISRYEGEPIKEQTFSYLSDPDFVDENLFALGLFAFSKRLVYNENNNIMKDWLFQNTYWTIQDQISFPYLLKKHRTNWTTYDFDMFNNNIVRYVP